MTGPNPQHADPALRKLLAAANRDPDGVRRRVQAARCERPGGLYRFIQMMWHTVEPARAFIPGWHLEVICNHLEAVSKGEIKRLLINISPGCSKSLILNVFWPAFEWGPLNIPHMRYLTFSYSQALTLRDNVRFRSLILSDVYQEFWGDRFQRSEDQFSLIKVMNNRSGWKIASSVSGLSTGERADRILCLEYETEIETSVGSLKIGFIVENILPVLVLGHNGQAGVWQNILNYEINEGSEVVEVEHDHGTIRATVGHPVWTEERGYVPVETLRPGECLVCGLRQGNSSRALYPKETEERLLFSGLRVDRLREQGALHMRPLRQGVHNQTRKCGEGQREVLFERMRLCWTAACRAAQRKGNAILSDLRKAIQGAAASDQKCERQTYSLFSKLRREGEVANWSFDQSRKARFEEKRQIQMPGLWQRILEAAIASCHQARAVLFETLHVMDRWAWQHAVSGGVDETSEGIDSRARWTRVSSLWSSAHEERVGQAARSPHRSQRRECGRIESDIALSELPSGAGTCDTTFGGVERDVGISVVRSIKRTGLIPKRTYNLRVSGCHNYFASNILMHNCDDPNAVMDAESEAVREGTNMWFTEIIPTRLNSPSDSAIIVIQQRTHMSDVSGTILDRDMDFEHLCIPLIYDNNPRPTSIGYRDPRGFDPETGAEIDNEGELMWPAMYPPLIVERLKRDLGAMQFSGQFQQSPVPRGGMIFDIDYWKPWPPPDDESQQKWINEAGKIIYPQMEYIVACVDTAFTEKEENDPSACVIMGVFRDDGSRMAAPTLQGGTESDPIEFLRVVHDERPKVMLMFAWERRVSLHGPPERRPMGLTDKEWNSEEWRTERQRSWGLVEWVADTCRRYKVDHLLIETQAQGHGLAQELRRLHSAGNWGVELIAARGGRGHGSKIDRAHSVQHLFSNGLIYVPRRPDTGLHPDWADKVITQMAQFPRAKHDDMLDSVIYCLRHLRDAGILVRGDEYDAEGAAELLPPPKRGALYEV